MATAEQFLDRFLAVVGDASVCAMCAIGDRLGLFRVLAERGPLTAADLARHGAVDERSAREWLHALASADFVTRDGDRFALPPEHAALLAYEESPFYLGGVARLLPALGGVLDRVVAGFRTGAGVPVEDYPAELFATMHRMAGLWLEKMLVAQWVPAVPGLADRLGRGGRVAHLASGDGRALVLLARAFPRCEFVGYDRVAANVATARSAAAAAGLADRVRFVHGDPSELDGGCVLVLALDVLHDALDLTATLRAVARAIGPDGVFLLLETDCAADPADNTGPAATLFYATSALYSVPIAQAAGGEAWGMMGLPEPVLRAACGAAGLGGVRTLAHPIPTFNTLYEIRAAEFTR
ncbi:methyltransferase [Saccharothrix obliqua]|uniref:methyltransferase n=1 Tax=Saccharothrix obliqua TaxID=2861747 RepID=UPI001C5F1DFF|nr:methyltransferase [Saccharothrix obliqua]MBW4721449.1 methyltransferase domain-containing protein [Saccharothrix obliqua]